MKNEKLLSAIGQIDDNLIHGAVNDAPKKKRSIWVKWGAMAACLCLVISGAVLWNNNSNPSGSITEQGSGPIQGGDVVPEGVDPIVASVAVIPAGVSLLDVADATSVSISEEDARNVEDLGAYLPNVLPDWCHYGVASYYETTMKDGTRYHMIRVTYEYKAGSVSAPVDESEQTPSETIGNSAFLWMVLGHRPDTDLPIYQSEEVTALLLDEINGGVFYIEYDGIYVGISQLEISTEDLLVVIGSIG